MKAMIFRMFIAVVLTGCGVDFYEAPDSKSNDDDYFGADNSSSHSSPYVHHTTPSYNADPEPDPCEDFEPTIRYTVKRNSRLETKEYTPGERLDGTIYLASYDFSKSNCSYDYDTSELFEDDLQNLWIEITSFSPYDPSFVKTYYVPSESVSFHDTSEELGMIIDLDYVVLDQSYGSGQYLIRVKAENGNGTVTSARTWSNDMEAFQYLGFEIPQQSDDTGETPVDEQNLDAPIEGTIDAT